MKSHNLALCLSVSLIANAVHAAGSPVGYVFQPDSPIRANEMNANFQELADRADSVQSDLDLTSQQLSSRIDALEQASPSTAGSLYIFSVNNVDGGTGRVSMNDGCRSVDATASFCSVQRIQNAVESRGIEFAAGFTGGWLEDWPGGCGQWTSNVTVSRAGTLDATGYQTQASCDTVRPVVCCR